MNVGTYDLTNETDYKKIGITLAEPRETDLSEDEFPTEFTSGASFDGDSAAQSVFFSDNSAYHVAANESGQAFLIKPVAQTVEMADVTMTYGETTRAVTASVTAPETGGGAITYEVTDGTDVVTVDADTGALTALKSGTATVKATAASVPRYLETSVTATVTVSKDSTTITTRPEAAAITYGQTLSESALTGGEGSVEGTFSWKDGTIAPAVSDSNTTEYEVVFTPAEPEKHEGTTCKVKLTVNKAPQEAPGAPEAESVGVASVTLKAVEGYEYRRGDGAWQKSNVFTGLTKDTEYSFYQRKAETENYLVSPAGEAALIRTEKEGISYVVTFTVANGSWDDGTKADRTVTLMGSKGETVLLEADMIPAVGAKPAEGYEAGSWNPEVKAGTGITADTTFTYTYAKMGSGETKTRMETHDLTELPESLKGIFGSLEEMKKAMMLKMTINGMPVTEGQIKFYDVILWVSFDGGVTWEKATAENFPTEGLRICLDYPEGTNRNDYDFAMSHVFTMTIPRLGTKAGEIETPKVTKTNEGVEATLMGLSPVALAWQKITTPTAAPTTVPKTGDGARPELWLGLAALGLIGILALVLKRRKSGR